MFLTQRHLPRRAVLKGIGATVALPFLDAMVPAGAAAVRLCPAESSRGYGATRLRQGSSAAGTAGATRLVCIEMVHGAAGSTRFGLEKNLWSPAETGRDFDLSPTSVRSLAPFRDRLTIVSNTDVANADPTDAREIGGDHFRSSAVFLTQAYPKHTDGGDVAAGISLDQLYAQRFGQETPIPSMQLCIEDIDQSGGCGYGYSCVYANTISWASATKPLPMIRDPRVVFDELFSVFGAGATPEERQTRRLESRSILDWIPRSIARLQNRLGPSDRARLSDYLDNVRQIERRIQAVEKRNGQGDPRELPGAPAGVPDSFAEHVELMFDLQLLAFTSDITRIFAFKLGRDESNRVYAESGFAGPFHPSSHHGEREDRILDFAKINTYHVGLLPPFLEKLQRTMDGDGSLLDRTVLLYGSPMGNPNQHNHKRVPFFVIAPPRTTLPGGRHVKAPNGTPLANAMLSILHALGLQDVKTFGDSEGALSLS
jgi:hypothetical protein